MRVVHLIQSFHPLTGGAERQLLAVAPLLQQRGVESHVVTRWHPGLASAELVHGIPVRRIGAPGARTGSLAFTALSQPLLRRLRPDVVHAYELLSPTTTAVIGRLHLGYRVVVKVLGGAEVDLLRSRPGGGPRLAAALRNVDAFHVVSDQIDNQLALLGVSESRRVSVPNGVDARRFRPSQPAERRSARHRLDIGDDDPLAVYVGRLSAEKGVEDLLEGWAEVRRAVPRAQLLLAGTGPQLDGMRRSVRPGVSFLGPIEDVPWLLRAADAFVLPSHHEGASNALLEAFAAGVPVLATSVGGTPDLAGGGRRACLVPPGSPHKLAAALQEVLTRGPQVTRRAAAALDWVRAERSLESSADRLVQLYADLSARR